MNRSSIKSDIARPYLMVYPTGQSSSCSVMEPQFAANFVPQQNMVSKTNATVHNEMTNIDSLVMMSMVVPRLVTNIRR